jgi:type IV pilus assembly protein PilW
MKTTIAKFSNRIGGRSLVEIMIALTIGIVILLAVTSLFIGNRQMFRVSDDKTRMDEEGRLALHLMATQIRMAGYGTLLGSKADTVDKDGNAIPRIDTSSSDDQANAIRGCRNGFVDPAVVAFTCAGGGGSDGFSVSRDVDQFSTVIASGGLMATDCLGGNVILTASRQLNNRKEDPDVAHTGPLFKIVNRFFIRNNPDTGNPELYCQGNGNTPIGDVKFKTAAQPIAENVETMRVLYGISTDALPGKSRADRYVTADAIDASLPAVAPEDRWARVVSVKVCIVVRSANNNVVTAPQSYRDCEDQAVVATDRRLRGVFSTTVAIRSRTVGATSLGGI